MAGQVIHHYAGVDNLMIKAFNLDIEKSLPSLYVIVEWLVCILLLLLITLAKRSRHEAYSFWLGLIVIFTFLLIDEFMQIHETLSWILQRKFNTSGPLLYAWIIPYSILLLLLGLLYLKFISKLTLKIRTRFLAAFSLFAAGSIGMELLEGNHVDTHGLDLYYYVLFVTIEESLEMAGLVVFINALITYINEQLGGLTVAIGSRG